MDEFRLSHRVAFVFHSTSYLCHLSNSGLSNIDLGTKGFLPRGLFERLIGKVLSWHQKTCKAFRLRDLSLYQDQIVLSFSNQRFRLSIDYSTNVIVAEILGHNPLAVHRRLEQQFQQTIAECMKSLQFFSALSCGSGSTVLVSLEYLRTRKTVDPVPGMTHVEVVALMGPWKPMVLTEDAEFHVFLSYRWAAVDSAISHALFDAFGYYTLGTDHRAVRVFLDHQMLKVGKNFKEAFVWALFRSAVFVPLISLTALEKMTTHNPTLEDNVLLEWLLAIELNKRIEPILIGAQSRVTGALEAFDWTVL